MSVNKIENSNEVLNLMPKSTSDSSQSNDGDAFESHLETAMSETSDTTNATSEKEPLQPEQSAEPTESAAPEESNDDTDVTETSEISNDSDEKPETEIDKETDNIKDNSNNQGQDTSAENPDDQAANDAASMLAELAVMNTDNNVNVQITTDEVLPEQSDIQNNNQQVAVEIVNTQTDQSQKQMAHNTDDEKTNGKVQQNLTDIVTPKSNKVQQDTSVETETISTQQIAAPEVVSKEKSENSSELQSQSQNISTSQDTQSSQVATIVSEDQNNSQANQNNDSSQSQNKSYLNSSNDGITITVEKEKVDVPEKFVLQDKPKHIKAHADNANMPEKIVLASAVQHVSVTPLRSNEKAVSIEHHGITSINNDASQITEKSLPRHLGEIEAPDTHTEVDTQENVDRVVRAARLSAARGNSQITLRLDPPELGSVRVQIKQSAGGVSVLIQATNSSAKEMLQHNSGELRNALGAQGINTNQIEIELRLDLNNEQASGQQYQGSDTQQHDGHDGQFEQAFQDEKNKDESAEPVLSGGGSWQEMTFTSLDVKV